MAGARADVYTSLLASVDNKAVINATPDTTQLQKGAYPTDVETASDTVTTTLTPLTSMLYGGLAEFGARPYREVVLADRPVGYWRLDETSGTVAHDSSGNDNNGTITGGVTLGVPGALASADTAMAFDGAGKIATPATMQSRSFSAECWVNVDPSVPSNNYPRFLGTAAFEGLSGWYIGSNGNGVNGYYIAVESGVTSPYWYQANSGDETAGVYHHVVGTYDYASNNLSLYVDGALTAHMAPASVAAISSTALVLGAHPGGDNLTGSLDEVAIYDYALTAAQVAAHYAAGSWRVATLTQVDALTRAGSIILAKNGTPYYASGTAQTPAIDLSPAAAVPGATLTVQWSECLPVAAVSASVQVRFSADGTTWGAWQAVTQGQVLTSIERYVQALVTLATTDTAQTPQFNWLRLAVATPAKWNGSEWQ